MTPDVKAKVLAAAARLAAAGELRPGFAARAVEREAVRLATKPLDPPRPVAG